MKKYTFLLFLFSIVLISSCKKNDETGAGVSPYSKTVIYQVGIAVGPTYNNFAVSYTGADGKMVVEPIVTVPWSKSILITDIRVTKTCTLIASSATISGTAQIPLSISSDANNTSVTTPFTFTSNAHDASISYTF
ncbi:hypothetical protein BDD43_5606 [Mucilaginibacter gracilis]|uniref:Uncharacterized protein n=1 Tax=Mucilaginibacter gracilis TaxID=423350 RepID=A0A495J8W6_9SPHI|nr:hypothetical protein [Mucilaginibacter gracilis]RKR85337.1 hypothetical protein BDD43_5606 [Mucilaginibacter gracilis]